ELRFTSPAENRLRYQLGAYYVFINNGPNVHVAQGIDPGGFVLDGFAIRPPGDPNETVAFNSDNVDTNAWAAFFVLNYDLTDNLELTVAGRYDKEEKETVDVSGFSPFYGLQRSDTFDEFQPKVSLAWRPTEDLSFYGGYARGFQAGGFNGAQTFQNCVNAGMCPFTESINEFGAAVSDSYEVGFKGRFLDRRLSVSAALFYEEKENTQQFQFLPAVTGNIIQTIDESEVLGFELESEAQITDNFVMTGGFAYIDSEITEFAAEPTSVGNQLPFVPEFTATITATHFWDIGAAIGRTGLTLVSGVQYEHRGEQFFEAGNIPIWEREALDLVNARIALESDDGWTLSFWGRNLTDKIFAEDVVPVFTPGTGLTTAVTMPSRPRTWGFEFSYDF
ncbi:MAG: TonB-dependent receptor, partial [Gammaproteobacteria bacterium]|nr:TonB-dependent receptor [Gammaproteobacteria bacterium]